MIPLLDELFLILGIFAPYIHTFQYFNQSS
jgi:hypothetical protein